MLHKTGARAVQEEGLTTQQWAVLGALSPPEGTERNERRRPCRVPQGQPARISRDSSAVWRGGHVTIAQDERDRDQGSSWTDTGRHVWQTLALPKIHTYYDHVLADISVNDTVHGLHDLLKILENMKKLDEGDNQSEDEQT